MNQTTQDIPASDRFDAREIPCSIKHGLIMEQWRVLKPGRSFVLVNDHDPVPLYYQFSALFPGEFDWTYEERGPETFAVRIAKRKEGELAAPSFQPEKGSRKSCGHSAPAKKSDPVDVDARGLEPPEPMMRILSAITTLSAGCSLRALTDRKPVHLIAELESKGYSVTSEECPDGSWLNTIARA